MVRIVYIGNFIAPRSTENAYRYAFERLGCEVIPVEQKDRPTIESVITRARDCDLVLYTRTHNDTALGVHGETNAEWTYLWRELESDVHSNKVTASVHLDVFVGVQRHRMTDAYDDPLFTTSFVFTPDPLLAKYIETDDTTHIWLPPAADVRHTDPPGTPIDGLAGKIVFVGSRYGVQRQHPEYPERAVFLDWLHNTYRADFYWYGGGSPFGPVRGKQLWDIYASDCIVVGDSCFAQSAEPRPMYWSDRVPETIAHGGLLVHPAVTRISEQFPMLAMWYPPDGYDALAFQIDTLRDALPLRNIRGQAAALCQRDHTYLNRARTILTTLGLE